MRGEGGGEFVVLCVFFLFFFLFCISIFLIL